ncbi:MAG: Veg family protein [Clostridia bacterium]|nr:Veg family protein [Clostridia bacterium]
MGTGIEKKDIMKMRSDIGEYIGQKVMLRGNAGRNRTFEIQGTLVGAYPNGFLVKRDDINCNITYGYDEVISRKVELGINTSNDGVFNSILGDINQEVNL